MVSFPNMTLKYEIIYIPKWASSTTLKTKLALCFSRLLDTLGNLNVSGPMRRIGTSELKIWSTFSLVKAAQSMPKLDKLVSKDNWILFKAVKNKTLGTVGN